MQHPHPPEEIDKEKQKAKKKLAEAAISAIIFHIALAVLAGVITIAVIVTRPPVTFEAKKPPSISARKLEHSIRVKQMQQQVRKPQILQRLVSQAPSAVALPELPKMDTPDMKKMRDTPQLNRSQSMLGDLGRAGGGLGRGDTGGGGFSDTKFFGENVRTRAVIIIVDVTTTIFKIGAIDALKKEAEIMLGGLNPGTKFNVVVFVDGAGSFQPNMVFALEENKKNCIEWINSLQENDKRGQLVGFGGTSSKLALEMALEMNPDTIFIITDGDYPKLKPSKPKNAPNIEGHADTIMDLVKSIETRYNATIKINPIIFYPTDDSEWERVTKDFYRRIVRLTGGKLKTIERGSEK